MSKRSDGRFKWILKMAATPEGLLLNSIVTLNPRTLRSVKHLVSNKLIIFCGEKIVIGENGSSKKDLYRITPKGEAQWLALN